ncbi:PRKC apoptosis WT1 regulator protein [Hypomesus transpacificus]|uniref:PRKC apoptosis WT1 regulator protein n=1 Tax=Hypomesus transpacificus TaxID=137520 RepID=UPI001F07DFB2|nr:PRKC apoptosis WT1 regulator protein [Hypomesus transpacificus]XP_046879165.1 PRKC apoptosis WT1 regulator protein [Hypomesus transpacificus]
MATGGFKSAPTDFLEEWKAKREKMRAKMLVDIAAATGACAGNVDATPSLGTGNSNKSETRSAAQSTELNNNANIDRGGSVPVNCLTSSPMARSSSSSALKRPDDDPHPTTPAPKGADNQGSNLKKTPPPEKVPCASQDSSPTAVSNDSDKESTSPGKGKEKKNSGPSSRKGKGQIEKRKLREKRRSTGVVSIPSNESLDELDDDDGVKKDEDITQHNTVQNEAMTDPGAAHLLQDTPRSGSGRHKSSSGPGSEEESGGNSRQRPSRPGREAAAPGGLERRLEDLEKELAMERQENDKLVKAHQDKDDLIDKLREEIDLLNRDLDDIEDENEQLKQENKTLLKVVGQLTR